MATSPEDILGWSAAFRRLVDAGIREGFAHAFLVESESAEGSAFYARALARAMNCDPDDGVPRPCGSCEPCRRHAAGAFPAFHEVWPIGVAVTIGQVQQIIAATSARFGAGVTKVFVIHAADRMQIPAANALLKTLEEPPERTVLVLATSSAGKVLPTIRSRCRLAKLALPEDDELASKLGLPPASAARLALALEVSGRTPDALLDLAARKKDLAAWSAPASTAELPMLVKKALKSEKDTTDLTPAHAVVAGGWYALNLAGALAVELGRLAASTAGGMLPATRRDALSAAVGLAAAHKVVLEAADEDWAERAKEFEKQYGDGFVHPRVAGEGKVSYPLGRAHSSLVMRAWLAVLRRVLRARTGDAALASIVSPGDVFSGLSRLTPAFTGELARVAETLKKYTQQNVAFPYVLDELMLSSADVLSGRALALAAADEAAEGA